MGVEWRQFSWEVILQLVSVAEWFRIGIKSEVTAVWARSGSGGAGAAVDRECGAARPNQSRSLNN